MVGSSRMWGWLSSWFRRSIPVEKEKEIKYDAPTPIVNIRVLPDQYKVNDKWWGTTLALKEQSANDKGENIASAEKV